MPITTGNVPKALQGGERMAKPKKWMQPEGPGSTIVKHPGALHRALHVPEGKRIPEKKLQAAKHSENPTTRRRAALAEVFRHANHHHGKHAHHPPHHG